jgi:hypothetical protein
MHQLNPHESTVHILLRRICICIDQCLTLALAKGFHANSSSTYFHSLFAPIPSGNPDPAYSLQSSDRSNPFASQSNISSASFAFNSLFSVHLPRLRHFHLCQVLNIWIIHSFSFSLSQALTQHPDKVNRSVMIPCPFLPLHL